MAEGNTSPGEALDCILDDIDSVLESGEENLSTRGGLRLTLGVLRGAVRALKDFADLPARVKAIEDQRKEEKKTRDVVNYTALAALVMLVFNAILFLVRTAPAGIGP